MTKFIFSFLCLVTLQANCQRATPLSRSELGITVGGMYYLGDLNPYKHYSNTQLAGGLLYRFNVNPRISLRFNLLYGNVKADDSESSNDLLRNRNLNFSSSVLELAGGVEFNYFPFEIGHKKHKGTAYILAQMGVFRMNPMTRYDGANVALQPLGTEGQGTSLSSKGNYSLTQLCFPIGVGGRITLGKWMTLGLEVGLRKTFTDYLDDVHADYFADRSVLLEESGVSAAALSNKNLDGSSHGRRGKSATKDWYVFTGCTLTFKLGKKNICHLI